MAEITVDFYNTYHQEFELRMQHNIIRQKTGYVQEIVLREQKRYNSN